MTQVRLAPHFDCVLHFRKQWSLPPGRPLSLFHVIGADTPSIAVKLGRGGSAIFLSCAPLGALTLSAFVKTCSISHLRAVWHAAAVVHIANVVRGSNTSAARLLPSEVFSSSSQEVRTCGAFVRSSRQRSPPLQSPKALTQTEANQPGSKSCSSLSKPRL